MRLGDLDLLLKEMNNEKTKYTCRIDINQRASKKDVIDITLKTYRGLIFEIIKDLPTVEVPQWIPCSERLPEIYEDSRTSEIVLVKGYDKEIDYEWRAMGWYADKTKQWYFAECKNTDKQIDWIDIIAWMPLP